MKKLIKSPQFVVGFTLILTIILMFLFNPEARSQTKPDSIQVYTFTVLPANFNTANKILTDKFCPKDKSGTTSDTVLLQNAMQMLFSNGKAVKIANPDKQKLISPKSK